jgi:hypothetical protein
VWDPGWEVHDLTLEDIVLAYLGQAAERAVTMNMGRAATAVAQGTAAGIGAGDRQEGRRA